MTKKNLSQTNGLKVEINNQAKYKVDLKLIRRVVNKFACAYKVKQKEISLALVDDQAIKDLNKKYRKINKPTDVLAFTGEGDFLGELVIDYDQIKRQASQFGNSVKKELIFILVHGLLHLIGYDDETGRGKREMIGLGEEFTREIFNF